MKKIFLLLIGLVSFSFAAEQYEFIVENSAMADAYFNIFNAISAMFNSNDYINLLRLTFLLGGFFVFTGTVLKAFSGEASGVSTVGPYAKYLLIGTALLTFAFSHKSNLWVTTNQTPSFCSTTNVTSGYAVSMPTTLAYVFSFTHKIGNELTIIMDSAFSIPTSVGSTSMNDSSGYLGSLKSAIQLLTVTPSRVTETAVEGEQVNFAGTLQNHINDCVYSICQSKGRLGDQKIEEFKNTKDISLWLQNFLEYKFADTEQKTGDFLTTTGGETLTCTQNFVYVKKALDKYKEKIACALPTLNGSAMKLLTGDSNINISRMQEISLQAGLINSLEESKQMNSVGISGATYATGKSKAEFTQTQYSTGKYLAEMMPMIQMVMRAILYALFPLVFVVILLPGGINVLKQYGQTLIWIELWMPTAAVINMFANMDAEARMAEVYKTSGLTLTTSITMLEDATTVAGYGSYLYASIPALTWLILKGSGSMLGNITSGISAGFAGNLSTEKQAEDLSKIKASKEADKTITQLEALHYGNKAASTYGEAVGFEKSGGMKPNFQVSDVSKREATSAKLSAVLNAGGADSYVGTKQESAGYGMVKEQTENRVTAQNGGDTAIRNVTEQGTGTAQVSANLKAKTVGSNGKVVDTESRSATNELMTKLGKLDNGSNTTTSYNTGAKTGAEEKGTSNVVSKKGTEGFKDDVEQKLSAQSDTAKSLKTKFGGNQGAANLTTYNNEVLAEKTNETKETFTSKENGSLQSKAEQKGLSNTSGEAKTLGKSMNAENEKTGARSAMEMKAENLKVDTNGDKKFSDDEVKNYQKIADTSAISDHASKEAKQKMLASNAEYFANDKGRVGEIYKSNLAKYGNETAAVAATMEAIEKDKKAVDTKINNKVAEGTKHIADNVGDKQVAETEGGVQKFEKQSDNLQKDFEEMIGTQSQEIKEDLISKGFSETEANTIVRDDLKKRNTFSENITKQTLDSEMKDIDAEKLRAYSANGVNSENVAGFKNKLSTMKKDLEKNSDKLNVKAKENLTNSIKGLETKINKYQGGIEKEFIDKKVDKLEEYMANGFINVDKKGNISFKDTIKDMNSMNTADRNVTLSKIQGASEGQKTSYVDFKGYTVDKIKDILGENTTHRIEATQSFNETGKFNRDILFHAVKNNYVDRKTAATATTVVNTVKEAASVVGIVGKAIE